MPAHHYEFGSYEFLDKFMGTRNERTFPSIRATSVYRGHNGAIIVRYQNTDVVIWDNADRVTLRHGGWLTPTTSGIASDNLS